MSIRGASRDKRIQIKSVIPVPGSAPATRSRHTRYPNDFDRLSFHDFGMKATA
jgi:hypothetical protein